MDVAVACLWRKRAGRFEILLTRRGPRGHLPGLWELPGGKLRPGESVAAALRRELREELGVRVGDLEPLACVEHRYPDRTVRLHALLATLAGGEAELAGREHRWVAVESLPSAPLPEANAGINAALAARLSGGAARAGKQQEGECG